MRQSTIFAISSAMTITLPAISARCQNSDTVIYSLQSIGFRPA
jgi:hypothetical protein